MKTKKHIQASTGPKVSRQSKSKKQSWKVIHPHAAGIDIGATKHYVAVPPDAVAAGESNVRSFGCFTEDIDAMVEWLKACGVDTVAMESTGVYWIVPFQKLEEAGMEVMLVNAQTLKHVAAKTDVQDCQWIQQLHSYGLLRASFRPDEAICRLRTLVRHRANLVSSGAEHVLHMQKALTQMNIQLHHVVSHLTGETGLRILRAILKGERDPQKLVELRDPQITRSSVAEMSKALVGDWRPELLFVLGQSLGAWEFYQEQMRLCDLQIEDQLKRMPSAPPRPADETKAAEDPLASRTPRPKAKQSRKRNDPERDLGPELARICGIDLTAAHGLRLLTVLTIISEIGVDLSKWRSAKAFTSWLGLNPNNKISGGRILSSRTRRVVNRVATALRMAGMGIAETDTWLGSHHRRMRARLGPAGANTASARKIGTIVYHLLKTKEPFIDRDVLLYEARVYKHKLARLKKQAKALGYELVETSEQKQLAE